MIHEPSVEVTCDGESCSSSETFEGYSLVISDTAIERRLVAFPYEWKIVGGRHYCEECKRLLIEEDPK